MQVNIHLRNSKMLYVIIQQRQSETLCCGFERIAQLFIARQQLNPRLGSRSENEKLLMTLSSSQECVPLTIHFSRGYDKFLCEAKIPE